MLHRIDKMTWTPEIFTLFSQKKPLLTAGTEAGYNTMTIGWGGLGTMWAKPACTVYVRPQRYTREFLDREERFSVAILPETEEQTIAYCGKVSGRDTDKLADCGLHIAFTESGVAYPAEAECVIVCRKLYRQEMVPACFTDADLEKWYPQQDYHIFYLGEVEEVYTK